MYVCMYVLINTGEYYKVDHYTYVVCTHYTYEVRMYVLCNSAKIIVIEFSYRAYAGSITFVGFKA